jgi:phosphohistidine phosphatase SixA
MMKLLLGMMGLLLAGCATTAPEGAAPSVYVMRHLHKAGGQDPGLSETGQRCAVRLGEQLAERGIGAIYASTTRRARETAAPLAARLGLTASEYDPRDTSALVTRVRAETGSALVVGHSNTVPDIVAALGGARPADLSEESYGEVWRVARDGAVTVERIGGC